MRRAAAAWGELSCGRTLRALSPGDRVWVNVPRTGYVGVGRVLEPVQTASEFKVQTPRGERLALDVMSDGPRYLERNHDPDRAEQIMKEHVLDLMVSLDLRNRASAPTSLREALKT